MPEQLAEQDHLEQAFQLGLNEGLRLGRARMMQLLIHHRFAPLPPGVYETIAELNSVQLSALGILYCHCKDVSELDDWLKKQV